MHTEEITAAEYRAAMRHYPAGVTVVTLRGETGPIGFTATSFASLSLRPPLISFNIAHTSSSIDALRAAESVVVHFLGEHQRSLAQRFSRAAAHRFSDTSLWTTLDTGEPVLHDTPVRLHCTVMHLHDIGDHTLVIARVTGIEQGPAAAPLLYHDGSYARSQQLD